MPKSAKNEDLLKEIRDNYDYCVNYWRDIREEAQTDMRYIAGDPWEPKERKAREDAGRPCMALDELNQYVNQLINDVRQNKRAITVVPKGAGANDKTSELIQGIIRNIEYKSNAQAAYVTAFENACNRSYGYFRISTQYVSESSFEQEIRIKRIPNPDTIYLDPDSKEADCSDMSYAFVIDTLTKKEFKRRFPEAELQDFSAQQLIDNPQWVKEESIQIAEYWKIKKTKRKLLLVNGEAGSYEGLSG